MAKANYWQRGETLDYVNPTGDNAAAVEAGDILIIGSKIGIAGCDIPVGGLGSVHVEGVYELPLADSTAVDLGALVYWDESNEGVTTTASTNILIGYCTEAASAGSSTIKVKINA